MTPRRLKSMTLLSSIVTSGLILLAWTQDWFTLAVSGTDTSTSTLSVAGSTAAPDLSALSLAGLALVAALAIAGPVLRIVFGVLQLAIGLAVMASSLVAIGSPVAASTAAVTKATGVSGAHSVAALVASVSSSAWPWVAVVLGAVTVVIGVFSIFTVRRWPGTTRRYESVPAGNRDKTGSSVSDWDELSGGSDPTSR